MKAINAEIMDGSWSVIKVRFHVISLTIWTFLLLH